VKLSWLENAYSHPLFAAGDFYPKIDQNDFVVSDQNPLVGLCVQDYKSLCAAVTICATLLDIQTHRHTYTQTHHFDQLIRIAQSTELRH